MQKPLPTRNNDAGDQRDWHLGQTNANRSSAKGLGDGIGECNNIDNIGYRAKAFDGTRQRKNEMMNQNLRRIDA